MTPRERLVLDAIRDHTERYGYAPTVRELATATGLTLNATHRTLGGLKEAGVLSWDPSKSRTNPLEQRQARVKAAIGTTAADVDPDDQAEAVMRLIGKKGWAGLKWTQGWATRKRNAVTEGTRWSG